MNRKLISIFAYVAAFALVLFFLQRHFFDVWQEVKSHAVSFNYGYLAASLILGVFAIFQLSFLWESLLRQLQRNLSVPRKKMLEIFSIGMITRYIPGKVWELASRTYFAHKSKISPQATVVSMAYEMTFLTLAGLIILAVFFRLPAHFHMLLALGTAVTIALLFTPHLHRLGIWILERVKLLNSAGEIARPEPLEFIIRSLLPLFTFGLGFAYFAISILPEENFDFLLILKLSAAFAVSIPIGALVIISPAGLGAREGLLALLLQDILPIPTAIFLSLAARIWAIAVELLFLGIVMLYSRLRPAVRLPGNAHPISPNHDG